MNYILFDTLESRVRLLPLTYTRPISEMRIGIMTIKEKWEKYLNTTCSYLTESYLQEKFPVKYLQNNIYIKGNILPNNDIVEQIKGLKTGEVLYKENQIIAFCSEHEILFDGELSSFEKIKTKIKFSQIIYPWDIFRLNGQEIENDYKLLTKNKTSEPISSTNRIIGENIFIEKGAEMEFTTINAKNAYIYIGKNALVMEGVLIRGSFALGENAVVKMGAKIYGPTTAGPGSKIGGEINNSVIFANSNKGHDGFLGNSVLGEWCNIGANSDTSNLKNNYAEVRVWSYANEGFARTGLQFCGLIMGDHSKCGINTMFNTGTVVGVNANIYGAGFPRNFIPSFSWGGALGFKEYKLNKAFEVNEVVMKRRNKIFDEKEQNILKKVFEISQEYRRFLKKSYG
ncbi:MAG: GlmU family protein [Bacteroidales bacterium]|nr:GlmU family protein [Bacteroidales bacterium]